MNRHEKILLGLLTIGITMIVIFNFTSLFDTSDETWPLIRFFAIIFVAPIIVGLTLWTYNNFRPIVTHKVQVLEIYETFRPRARGRGFRMDPVSVVRIEFIATGKRRKFTFEQSSTVVRNTAWGDRVAVGEIGILKLKGTRVVGYEMLEGRYYPIGKTKCDKCEELYDKENAACPYCGYQEIPHWRCSTCGDKNFSITRICSGCGEN